MFGRKTKIGQKNSLYITLKKSLEELDAESRVPDF